MPHVPLKLLPSALNLRTKLPLSFAAPSQEPVRTLPAIVPFTLPSFDPD